MKLTQAKLYAETDSQQEIDKYIDEHSDPEPQYLTDVVRATHLHSINPRMMSGHLQGRLLKLLVEISKAEKIVEIGTFSGYSTLCMAEGLPENGRIDTIEIDDEQETFILKQLSRSENGKKIKLHIGDATHILPQLTHTYDLAFIDADKRCYLKYYELLLPIIRQGGIILADNTLWDGKVLNPKPASNDHQTIAIKAFNDFIAHDSRVEKIIIPLRDGLTLIRKK